ncbi:unnamed protein product [Prunus armeniaca]
MTIIPVGSSQHRVTGPNRGSFRGEIGARYGNPRICKILDQGWAGDGINPIPEPENYFNKKYLIKNRELGRVCEALPRQGRGRGFPEKPKPGIGPGTGTEMVSGDRDGDGIVIPNP